MNTDTPASPVRLVGLCGDRRCQYDLASLMVYDGPGPGRGFGEVSTRDRARDLAASMQADLDGTPLADLVEMEGWLGLLAGDTAEAVRADIAVEAAHRGLVDALGLRQFTHEVADSIRHLVADQAVVVTGIDSVELAHVVRDLGGILVQVTDCPAAIGTPLLASPHQMVTLDLLLTGPDGHRTTLGEALTLIESALAPAPLATASPDAA